MTSWTCIWKSAFRRSRVTTIMAMFAFLIDPWQRQAGVSVFGWGVDRASVADRVTVGFSLLACPLQGLMQTFEIFYPLPIFYWAVLPKPIFFFSLETGSYGLSLK